MRIFTLVLSALFATVMVSAANVEYQDITYVTNDDGTCSVGTNKWAEGDVVIPETITDEDGATFTVTKILKNAFAQAKSIESVSLPRTIKVIERLAFADSSVKSVSLQEGIEEIGYACFDGCSNLESIVIPNSVTELGSLSTLTGMYGQVFMGCKSLKSATLPTGITVLRENTFKGCGVLESITIPSNITTIENNVFDGCMSLKEVNMHDNITSIGSACFTNCRELSRLKLPAELTEIPGSMFLYCYALESVEIPEKVKTIGRSAFAECYALQEVKVPDSVTFIGTDAFGGCCSVKNADLGNGLEYVGYGTLAFFDIDEANHYIWQVTDITVRATTPPAFKNETQLTELSEDFFIGSIDMPAEEQSAYLKSITLHVPEESLDAYKNHSQWGRLGNIVAIIPEPVKPTTVTVDGMVFTLGENSQCELTDGSGATGDVTIPETVTDDENNSYSVVSIARLAFSSNVNITSVAVPASVTEINDDAFSACTSLTSATLPDGLKTFGEGVFRNCSGLTSVKLPSAMENMPANTLLRCSALETLELGASLKTVNSGSLAVVGTADNFALKSITINAAVPPVYADGKDGQLFFGISGVSEYASFMFTEHVVLYVPEGAVEAYKAAVPWNMLLNIRQIGDEGGDEGGIDSVQTDASGIVFDGVNVTAQGRIDVYSIAGIVVATGNGTVSLDSLPAGMYVVKAGDAKAKIVKK